MKARILNILNIKPSESGYIFDLLRIQLFIGIANSFVNIVAITLFIHEFRIEQLPEAYLISAFFLLGLNVLYEKIEKRFPPLDLLKYIIVTFAIILLLLWIGMNIWDQHSFIFVLLIWTTLIYMITGYAYWGLVSMLFNVRESKRVFSVVGAGDIPAKLIGYLAVFLFEPLVGTKNLIWLSIIALVYAYFMFRKVTGKQNWDQIRQKSHHHHHTPEHAAHKHRFIRKDFVTFFFKHELILAISLLSIISYNVFNLIDFTFISQIKRRYDTVSELTKFVAIFFAFGRLIALALKLIFTSRLIERLGIITCLFITPVALAVFSGIFFFTGEGSNYNLYIFGIMAVLTEVLRSTMQEPVFFILFQPLKEQLRLKGHIISKGYMFAPSLLIVGTTLLILEHMHIPITIFMTVKYLLINIVIWFGAIYFIRHAYLRTLHGSIRKGVFHSEQVYIYPDTTRILLAKIKDGSATEILYSLTLLENAEYEEMRNLLEQMVHHPSRDVRKYAIERLEHRNEISTALFLEQLQVEPDPDTRQKLVAVLCKHDPAFLNEMSEKLDQQEDSIRKVVIITLLNQAEFSQLFKAGTAINSLIHSESVADRELAISIISELKHVRFTDSIAALIQDSNMSIRRAAIMAACKLRIRRLLPALTNMLAEPANRYIILQGFQQYGDELFHDINKLDQGLVDAYEQEFIRTAGRVKGPHSTGYLLRKLGTTIHTDRAIHALWIKGYDPVSEDEINQLNRVLDRYLSNGYQKIAYYFEVPDFAEQPLLESSLYNEVENDLVTALKTCSILYRKSEINRVLELLDMEKQHKLFNGMEMLEMVLPKKRSKDLNLLFDFVLDPSHTRKTHVKEQLLPFFNRILITEPDSFTAWTKAVCLYCSWKIKQFDFLRSLKLTRKSNDHTIMKETQDFVFGAIK